MKAVFFCYAGIYHSFDDSHIGLCYSNGDLGHIGGWQWKIRKN